MQQVWDAQGKITLLSFMRKHDEDRLVHHLRHAKTLQGTYAPAAHVQLIYAMHASSLPHCSDGMSVLFGMTPHCSKMLEIA